MPHELAYTSSGEAMMMFVGKKPWHGLGVELDYLVDGQTAVRLAGCDYTVETQPMYRWDGADYLAYPNRFAIVRSDTNQEFDIVSHQYEILQNTDAAEFFNEVWGQGEPVIETCGALKDGRTFWMLARQPETYEPVKNDPIAKYILLSSSHDRTQSLEMATTNIRTVCSNTHRFALANAEYRIKIRHTSSIHERAVQAREALNLSNSYNALMMEGVDRLVRTPMRASEMGGFASAYLNLNPKVANKDRHLYSQEAMECLTSLFEVGRGQDIPGVRGTAYAALNAATEYLDYHKRVSLPDMGAEPELQQTLKAQGTRLHRSWFGRGQGERNHAWNLLQRFSQVGISAFDNQYTPRVRHMGFDDAITIVDQRSAVA